MDRTAPRAAAALAALLLAGCASPPACDAPPGFAFDPRQCGGNPWDPPEGQVERDRELEAVREHYAARGVRFGLLESRPERDFVAAVCGAHRSDRLHATLSEGDPALLLDDGWFTEPAATACPA